MSCRIPLRRSFDRYAIHALAGLLLAAGSNGLLESVAHAQDTRTDELQTESLQNLKHLSLAMLLYENNHKSFPPAASKTYHKGNQEHTSEHPHSWRVAILPHLERQDLYNQYRFDEPWDSEANLKVLEQMPDAYRSPHDDPDSTNTGYFVFTGPDTIFHDDEGTRLMQIRDGTSRTLLIVEAKRPVPWTKPEDIPYAADQPMPELGGWVPGEFVAVTADGRALRISSAVGEQVLRAWISRSGGEPVPPPAEFPPSNE